MLIFHYMNVKVIFSKNNEKSTSFSLLNVYAFTLQHVIAALRGHSVYNNYPLSRKMCCSLSFVLLTRNKNTCIIFCNEKNTIHVYDTQICHQEFSLDFSFKASIYFAAFFNK